MRLRAFAAPVAAVAVVGALAACKAKPDKPAEAAATPTATTKATDPWAAPTSDKPVGDPAVQRLVDLAKHGPEHDKYPEADAIVADARDDITLRDDGTVVERHHSIVKLFDAQRGKEKFADLHIPYDTRRQTLEIQLARTVNSDGVSHVASPDEIGDIVPPRLSDATVYSDVRERVVSFPAVDKGSVIELDYTRTTKPGPDAPMGGEQMLAMWDPILSRTVTITVPSGVTPRFAVEGMTLAPSESGSGATRTYSFVETAVPDRQRETESVPERAILPRLIYSFQPDWNHALQPVADRFLARAVPSPLPEVVVQEAQRIVAAAKTDAARAQAIFKFVAHDVRSIDLPFGWAGYEPHAPDVVLANRYGDDRDKVGLLLALAAAVKLDGRPVLVRTGKVPVVAGVPTLAQFDRMIAKLAIDGKDVWLDPSDENGQFGVAFAGQDNLVLPVQRNGAELGKRPPLDPSTSVSHTEARFTLAANGQLDARYTYHLSGWFADRASGELRPLKGENLARMFARSAAELSASATDKAHEVGDTLSVTGSIDVTHDVTAPGYSEAQGGFRVFELPPPTLELADALPSASLTKRKYPLWIGTPRTQKSDISVAVPAGWKVAYVPPRLEGSADGISYRAGCEATGQTISCHTEVTLDKLDLAPDQYAGLRDALTKLRAYERCIVLLTKA